MTTDEELGGEGMSLDPVRTDSGEGSLRTVAISVRELVSFVWCQGGLRRSSEGGLPNRALRGTRGHQELQRKRPADYVAEVSIKYHQRFDGFRLRVYGRVDGVYEGREPLVVEEIKTVTRLWDGRADSLHQAQLRFYAAVLAKKRRLPAVETVLTYFNLDSRSVKVFEQTEERSVLDRFLDETLKCYGEWLSEYFEWCRVRDQSLFGMEFPLQPLRQGQEDIIDGVESAIANGQRLFLEAATGLGKTMGVLYPASQAFPGGKVDRIFFLSAKNTGKEAATKALEILRGQGARLRSLNLRSKTSTCVRGGQPCDPSTCPLANDYYRNQKEAMREALKHEALDYDVLARIGDVYKVCPFELALDVSPFVDVVICDYHYIFDSQSTLQRAFSPSPGRFVALIDECHNLVERGREMYSARLEYREAAELRREIGRRSGSLRRCLAVFQSLFTNEVESRKPHDPDGQAMLFGELPSSSDGVAARDESTWRQGGVEVGMPKEVTETLSHVVTELETWLAAGVDAGFNDRLLELYFEVLRYLRLSEHDGSLFRFYLEQGKSPAVKLFCVDPSSLLRESLDEFHASICFSGTMSPVPLFRQLLGGDSTDPYLSLQSPFDRKNLRVEIEARVDTRLKNRKFSEGALVEAILRAVARESGSFLVFFSSYDYLREVMAAVRNRYVSDGYKVLGAEPIGPAREAEKSEPLRRFRVEAKDGSNGSLGVSEWVWQAPGMNDRERDALLRNLASSTCETVVTFAVLGGLFGEGVDLPENCLKGVIVVGVGYPMISRERDLVASHFDEKLDKGFEVAYLVPGMNRVLQAAGRLIRSERDRGSVVLIDRRYQEPIYRELLPSWWGLV